TGRRRPRLLVFRRPAERQAPDQARDLCRQRQRSRPSFSVAADYRRNYAMIRSRLADQLLAGMNVFTHAPWGEYGHEDHVQVYRVLESLRDEIGFTLWVSN